MTANIGGALSLFLERPCRLLVVDDEEAIRKFIYSVCAKSGYHVEIREAGDGAAGFEEYLSFMPDIVITDVMMPVMDGIELLKKIRETSREVDVILVTGFADTRMVTEALRARATNFIEKPFGADDMIAELGNRIRKWQITARASRLEGQLNRERSLRERTSGMATAGRLVAGMASEISKPLTYLKGNAELVTFLLDRMAAGEDDPALYQDAKLLLKDIAEGADRIEGSLGIMKKFQRLSSERIGGPVELGVLITDTEALARGRCPKNVEFRAMLPAGKLYLDVHPMEIESCLLNMIVNGFEETAPVGGTVEFYSRSFPDGPDGGLVEITVCHTLKSPLPEGTSVAAKNQSSLGFWLWVAHQAAENNGSFIDITEQGPTGSKAVLRFRYLNSAPAGTP